MIADLGVCDLVCVACNVWGLIASNLSVFRPEVLY